MKPFASILLGTVMLLSAQAKATSYNCTIGFYFDGFTSAPLQVRPYSEIAPWKELRLREFTFDDQTGLMTHPVPRSTEGEGDKWKLINRPGTGNDIVAVWQGECGVSCPFAMLRVRPWEKPTRFVLEGEAGGIMAGECTP